MMVSIKFTRDREGKALKQIKDAPTYTLDKRNKDINSQAIRVHDKKDVTERKDKKTKSGFKFYSRKGRVIRTFRSHVKYTHAWKLTRTLNPSQKKSFQYVMSVAFFKGGKTQVTKGFSFRKSYSRTDYPAMRQEAWEMAYAKCGFSPERFKILEEYFIGYDFKPR